jgi:hypothetical protein
MVKLDIIWVRIIILKFLYYAKLDHTISLIRSGLGSASLARSIFLALARSGSSGLARFGRLSSTVSVWLGFTRLSSDHGSQLFSCSWSLSKKDKREREECSDLLLRLVLVAFVSVDPVLKECAAILLRSRHRHHCCSCTLVVVMGYSSTSSGHVPVLRCPVLLNGTDYHNWVPHICLHMRGFRLWEFLMGELPCPPSPLAHV